MNKVLYLITSHTNPDQVVRLARTLRKGSPDGPIVIHHDGSRTRLDPALLFGLSGVHLLPFSTPVEWGDFSIVEMNLRSFEWILQHLDFDWMVLLSGQDYPIKPLSEVEAFLARADVDGFLEEPQLLKSRAAEQDRHHIRYTAFFRYFYRYRKLPHLPLYARLPRRLRRLLRRASEWLLPRVQNVVFVHPMPAGSGLRVGLRRLKTPFDETFRCYKSSQWFTLSRPSVELLAGFARDHPHIVNYYRRTVIPDESFFQTVLVNHPGWRLFPDNMLFFRWNPSGAGSPDVLTSADVGELLASGKHFARKFDPGVDSQVLDRLDEHLFRAQRAK